MFCRIQFWCRAIFSIYVWDVGGVDGCEYEYFFVFGLMGGPFVVLRVIDAGRFEVRIGVTGFPFRVLGGIRYCFYVIAFGFAFN